MVGAKINIKEVNTAPTEYVKVKRFQKSRQIHGTCCTSLITSKSNKMNFQYFLGYKWYKEYM